MSQGHAERQSRRRRLYARFTVAGRRAMPIAGKPRQATSTRIKDTEPQESFTLSDCEEARRAGVFHMLLGRLRASTAMHITNRRR